MGNRHRFRSSDPEVLHILRECHRIRNRLGTQCGTTKLSTNRPIGKGEDIEEHPLNQKSDSYKDQPTDDLPPERRRVAIVVVGAYPVEDGPIGYSVRDRWAQGYEYPPARIPGLRDDLEDTRCNPERLRRVRPGEPGSRGRHLPIHWTKKRWRPEMKESSWVFRPVR